jgi:peptide/nickel transport system permease protein
MNYWIQNLIILAGVGLLFLGWRLVSKSERWERARTRFRRDVLGRISLTIILLYGFFGLMDSIQIPFRGSSVTLLEFCFKNTPREKGYSAPLSQTTYALHKNEPLKGRHWLGTDVLGKDVLLQTLKACRTALIIGGLTSLIYVPLGVLFGVAAGYYKRWVDDIIQYIYSTLHSIPSILLLIAILMILGKGLVSMSIALGVTSWVGLCRLIRGETMRQTERSYIEAARALGQSNSKIIFRHLIPNVMHLVLINFILGFSGLILAEAILSYLGVGAPVGTASWGLMIDSARMELAREPAVWWNITSATMALFILVLCLNLLGDSLRKAFDPRAA